MAITSSVAPELGLLPEVLHLVIAFKEKRISALGPNGLYLLRQRGW